MKITNRDVKVFLFGMIAMFALISALDWENNLSEFKAGYSEARSK